MKRRHMHACRLQNQANSRADVGLANDEQSWTCTHITNSVEYLGLHNTAHQARPYVHVSRFQEVTGIGVQITKCHKAKEA